MSNERIELIQWLAHAGKQWPELLKNRIRLPAIFKKWRWASNGYAIILKHDTYSSVSHADVIQSIKLMHCITPREEFWREPGVINQRITAPEFLDAGAKHMRDRATQRDSETGERSMKACVDAFNALYGSQLTETQGWQFMVLLKMSRARTGIFCRDDYEDQAAYAALAGESAQ